MRRVCVFCGSAVGTDPTFAAAARAFGAALVGRRLGLVYGGGAVGLMGVLADAVLAAGGEVIGIIPRGLASKEIAHPALTELRVVPSMHERKALMAALADGFVALPGGVGTLEELLEVFTWLQLGILSKPIGVLEVAGYWRGLRTMLADAVRAGFVDAASAAMLLVADDPDALLDRLARWTPPATRRPWLEPDES